MRHNGNRFVQPPVADVETMVLVDTTVRRTGEDAMKVLVTGASGQLAPFVIRALRERHDLVLMSRHPPDAEFAAFPWLQGDLTVYAIQHLAAQPWPVDHPALRGRVAAHSATLGRGVTRTSSLF